MITGTTTFRPSTLSVKVSVSDAARRSWIKSARRLSTCPNCGGRARIRRTMVVCDRCHLTWPVGDIQDLIAEIEALFNSPINTASSLNNARERVPSLSAGPGVVVSKDNRPGDDYFYRLNTQINRELKEER